jgi:hypothetical protein
VTTVVWLRILCGGLARIPSPHGWTGPPLLNTATAPSSTGLPDGNVAPSAGAARSGPASSTCLGGNLVGKMSNTIGSVIDLSDASSSPRAEPLWQVFLPGERGVRTARQRPHPQPLIGLFVCLATDRLREIVRRSCVVRCGNGRYRPGGSPPLRRRLGCPERVYSPLLCAGCGRRPVIDHVNSARISADRRKNQPNRRNDNVIAAPAINGLSRPL